MVRLPRIEMAIEERGAKKSADTDWGTIEGCGSDRIPLSR